MLSKRLRIAMPSWTSPRGTLFGSDTTIVQIDNQPSRLGFHRSVNVGVVADARTAAEAISLQLARQPAPPRPLWRSNTTAEEIRAADHNIAPYDDVSTADFIDPRTLSKAINSMLPASCALAIDNGHFMAWPPRHIKVQDARASSMGGGFQAVGLGLASAVGLALARPSHITVLGIGDGGFRLSLADLESEIRLSLKLCIVIYNDAGYGAEVHPFAKEGDDVSFVQFPASDLAGVARSMGAEGIVVRKVDDLAPLEQWVERGGAGVFVIDA